MISGTDAAACKACRKIDSFEKLEGSNSFGERREASCRNVIMSPIVLALINLRYGYYSQSQPNYCNHLSLASFVGWESCRPDTLPLVRDGRRST